MPAASPHRLDLGQWLVPLAHLHVATQRRGPGWFNPDAPQVPTAATSAIVVTPASSCASGAGR
jgi:hypothetical protein